MTLGDAGSDLLEYDGARTEEAFIGALSENTLGLSVCETLLDALAFRKEVEKKIMLYLYSAISL